MKCNYRTRENKPSQLVTQAYAYYQEAGFSKKEAAERAVALRYKTKSKAFKEWFGDWETDPENSSQVVNEVGV